MFKALLDLQNEYLAWHTEEETFKIKQRFSFLHGLPNCIGIVDGTPINLFQKPGIDIENHDMLSIFKKNHICAEWMARLCI